MTLDMTRRLLNSEQCQRYCRKHRTRILARKRSYYRENRKRCLEREKAYRMAKGCMSNETREVCQHCGKPIKRGEDHHCEDAVGDRKAA